MKHLDVNEALGRYLSIRPHSRAEVVQYLKQRSGKYNLSSEDIESLVDKYAQAGFINDALFVESVTHSLVHNKSRGPAFLKMKLKSAGVDKTLIDEALKSLETEDIRSAMGKRLERYRNKLAKLDPRLKRAKAYQILFTSGFSSGEIGSFIDDWLREE